MRLIKPTIVNKKIVDVVNQPKAFRLHHATDIFIKEGTQLNLAGETTLASMSYDIMNTMGITMIDPEGHCGTDDGFELLETNPKEFTSDYSFVKARNNDEGIDNPNIVDPDIEFLKPIMVDAKDKFVGVNDPFYNQDEELPESIKHNKSTKGNKTKVSLIAIADYMCVINMNNKTKIKENKYLNRHKNKSLRRIQ